MRHTLTRQQLYDMIRDGRIEGCAQTRHLRRRVAQAMREARHPLPDATY
jgi:hypothetical protein